jgi:hypothetical protein
MTGSLHHDRIRKKRPHRVLHRIAIIHVHASGRSEGDQHRAVGLFVINERE